MREKHGWSHVVTLPPGELVGMQLAGAEVDLLAENNQCGRTLLNLVARGCALVAELLRAADRVPDAFRAPPTAGHRRILMDFGYFADPERFEAAIEADEVLWELNEELAATHWPTVEQCYAAFEAVYNYVVGLNSFTQDLEQGVYMQHNLETLFQNTDGSQLLCEAVYLYCVMLLVLDRKLPGLWRERLIVAYYRYSLRPSAVRAEIDEVCGLLRATGYDAATGAAPPEYPVEYFARVPLNEQLVSMAIGRLRSDDLYLQLTAFPLPEHRSTALAQQGAMLYACLFLSPDTLRRHTAAMREIVDRYFADNWVVPVYLGIRVNLVDAWQPFKAARLALANSVHEDNVARLAESHASSCRHLVKKIGALSTEGGLDKTAALTKPAALLGTLRSANVALRWLLLHTCAAQKTAGAQSVKLREQVLTKCNFVGDDESLLFDLLLATAQFEVKMKNVYEQLLSERSVTAERLRADARERLIELAQVFSGEKPLTRVKKNEKLQAWFERLAEQVQALQFDRDLEATGRAIVLMCNRLNEVRDLHNLSAHVSVRQFVADIGDVLQQLLRVLDVKPNVLWKLQAIGDFSYAWELVHEFTDRMQAGIRRQPLVAMRLRAAFLKLASGLDVPLMRIAQAGLADLEPASQFYSRQLVTYIRHVLQVIPATVFSMLNEIITLQTDTLRELPSRVERDKMKEHAKLEERHEMARLTHDISVLTDGLLAMRTTLVGIICVEPRRVLNDGIRRELVARLALLLDQAITQINDTAVPPAASTKRKSAAPPVDVTLSARLQRLAAQMDACRRSFTYISDYISMDGLRVWQHELSRLVGFALEHECNRYRRRKIQEDESIYQSRTVPIPSFAIDARTFLGALFLRLLESSGPQHTIYVQSAEAWYTVKERSLSVDSETFSLLMTAVGAQGCDALARLAAFELVHRLQPLHAALCAHGDDAPVDKTAGRRATVAAADYAPLKGPAAALKAAGNPLIEQPQKFYDSLISKRSGEAAGKLAFAIAQLGQIQLVRWHLLRQLAAGARLHSRPVRDALLGLDRSLMADVEKMVSTAEKPPADDRDALYYELSQQLQSFGLADVAKQVYFRPSGTDDRRCSSLAHSLFVASYWLASKCCHVTGLGPVYRKQTDAAAVDPTPFCWGLAAVFRQYPPGVADRWLRRVAQCADSHAQAACDQVATGKTSTAEIRQVVPLLLCLTENVSQILEWPQEYVSSRVSPVLLGQCSILLQSLSSILDVK